MLLQSLSIEENDFKGVVDLVKKLLFGMMIGKAT
jgi:hypothetical protein